MWITEGDKLLVRARHFLSHTADERYQGLEAWQMVMDNVYDAIDNQDGAFTALDPDTQAGILAVENDPSIFPGWESEYPAPTEYWRAQQREREDEEAEGITADDSE